MTILQQTSDKETSVEESRAKIKSNKTWMNLLFKFVQRVLAICRNLVISIFIKVVHECND